MKFGVILSWMMIWLLLLIVGIEMIAEGVSARKQHKLILKQALDNEVNLAKNCNSQVSLQCCMNSYCRNS